MIRGFVLGILIVLGLVGYGATIGRASFQPKLFEFDLIAFSCGSSVAMGGYDPYHVEPLRSCEHSIGTVFRHGTKLAIPDPLPPYDFGLLAPLGSVPYADLQLLWLALQIGVCALTGVVLVRLSGLPYAVVASALIGSDLYCSALLGQIASISILGIVVAGYAIERRRQTLLIFGLILAMLEPHLGLPAVCAIALFGGRMRVAAVVTVMLLVLIAVATFPLTWIWEYFTRVIPAHAMSEINNEDQFGTLYLLHSLRASDTIALETSKLIYVIALVIGVAYARTAARSFGIAMLCFAPVVFVLIGAPYMHVTQLAAALPAALLIAGRSTAVGSRVVRGGVAALSVPWVNFMSVVTILPVVAVAIFILLRQLCGLRPARAVLVTATTIVAEIAAAFAIANSPQAGAPKYGPMGPDALPELSWKAIIDMQQHGHVFLAQLGKIPSLLGITAVIIVIVHEAWAQKVGGVFISARSPWRSSAGRSVVKGS